MDLLRRCDPRKSSDEVAAAGKTNFIDTGYEIVDINNYEEVWASKSPW